jgi:hypothetical protein
MVNVHVCLAIDSDIRIMVRSVSQVVQGEAHRTIGGVLKRHNTSLHLATLDLVKHVFARKISTDIPTAMY